MSATLQHPLHINTLQTALEAVLLRFPYYAAHVRRGIFWSYREANDARPQVLADSRFPCQHLPVHRGQAFPFRVRAYHHRMAVEFSHILTDGSGTLHFLRALVAEYLRCHQGLLPFDSADLMLPGQIPDPAESEDAFRRYHSKELPKASPKRNCDVRLPAMWSRLRGNLYTTGTPLPHRVRGPA